MPERYHRHMVALLARGPARYGLDGDEISRRAALGITPVEDDPTVLVEPPDLGLPVLQDPEGNEFCIIE